MYIICMCLFVYQTCVLTTVISFPGCIFTYKGHSQQVNSLKFSPDGQWVASAGEEGAVKVNALFGK
jgi:WD40 repeat protein